MPVHVTNARSLGRSRVVKRCTTFRLVQVVLLMLILLCWIELTARMIWMQHNHNYNGQSIKQQSEENMITHFQTQTKPKPPSISKYNPLKCKNMINGHCRDDEGGAWSYKNPDGSCLYDEKIWVPRDTGAVDAMPQIFADVKDGVLDFGGGVGAYMTSFRDAGVTNLVVMEPYELGHCLFRGLNQIKLDLVNTPIDKLPKKEYNLVMTTEVCEHIPAQYHNHVIQALTNASKRWLLFSAAHPGQGGEGHVGPSMKTRDQWISEIETVTSGEWKLDEEKTDLFLHACIDNMLRKNAFIMRRRNKE